MPRKEFLRDLADAAVPGRFPCISDVRTGDYDGSISFTFAAPGAGPTLDLQAIVSDSHDYPKEHGFLAFSSSEDCPKTVTSSLENAVPCFTSLTINDLLSKIESIITNSIVDPDSTSSHPEDTGTQDPNDDESAASDTEPDWESDDENIIFNSTQSDPGLREKIRRDLRAVKNAGFKVGYLGSKYGTIIVSVSCRISKLGISEEAMNAWSVESSEYLVLLIRYRPTYFDLHTIIETAGDPKSSPIQMHVGLCNSYKPSLEHAMEALQGPPDQQTKDESTTSDKTMCGHLLKPLFIGRSLNLLLGERLFGIINLRLKHGFSWTGAELFFQTNQGRIYASSEISSEEHYQSDCWATSTPEILVADHMTELDHNISNMSLPLLAIQFTLRHFIKCTEFCLVCHCKTGDTFESLKPYVCSNALCLYQYMALDLGPSLEYEIRSQPFVVDLLTSLAYSRASSGLLEDFPTGLRLRVPEKLLPQKTPDLTTYHTGQFDAANLEIQLNQPAPVKVGDWIVLIITVPEAEEWHCRIKHVGETSNHIRISPPISKDRQLQPKDLRAPPRQVKIVVYDTNLDDLAPVQKQHMISCLLGMLPGIKEMKAFIGSHESGKLLSSWRDVISPAGLDLLRWVVASNRSFIKQDDDNPRHQVVGMSGYIQFRLVQGAADKEQRFINAVNSNSLAQNPNHPTIFAWHGSPVNNWHSILREGFHFKQILHGRACGHGVYMSNHFHTSLGYTGTHILSTWSETRLKLSTVISLNEVVNAPHKFVNHSPHYVVQHLDWIQPRYLFVRLQDLNVPGMADRTGGSTYGSTPKSYKSQSSSHNNDESHLYKQDQRYLALGPNGLSVKIPISVFSGPRGEFLRIAREAGLADLAPSSKRRKYSVGNTEQHENDDDYDNASIETTLEDLNILLSDDEMSESSPGPSMQGAIPELALKTDFRPGTLQDSILPTLSSPRFATTSGTKVLQQHLQATIKIQERVPLHELGWYVDPSLITTVYQWVVELHTFDPSLPLAQDLKAINQKSVVMEFRFPPQFPMDPPLVRVIRPRFLEFAAGGGGHVTAGGSMCMELLTHSGWLPTASIESVLLQVRMAITNTDPRPARLNINARHMDYSVGEAVEAYRRVALAHGWQISKDIQKLAW
ncbi:Ubiquitin-conjugating enzyme, E2 [Penicillium expansum]|uniref:Ubiquitin-conjugating enzyme, E2 n=1 Tax=Penicillium expansum TaxID=27334 RepID=A0A0A2I4B9_PENEN|nr:Ubiquitin-conjugating enzyme, E2 [Penicillium expansum]KGO37303.1 Ubiquitin-conjugating enzyme, E2 [Penicillium expansum]KGO57530.1 Ubiquitin-conjugating enzyme, E2 [Penicillium expansum]KGO66078.1 Ubiquitin-conjugating enzyme, E2 [Penicillium expansum]